MNKTSEVRKVIFSAMMKYYLVNAVKITVWIIPIIMLAYAIAWFMAMVMHAFGWI